MLNLINLSNLVHSLYSTLSSSELSKTVEMLNTSFVSTVLTLLIVASLVLTFHSSGTTVHKVLGLLLVSIFVVFLWILQTQFLFIYVVYIMAFISAVLMLFLSVVLMLPISTLTSKNYHIDSNRGVNNFSGVILFIVVADVYDFVIFNLFVAFVTIGFLSFGFLAVTSFKNINWDIKNMWHFLFDGDFYNMLRGKGDYDTLIKKADEVLFSTMTWHIRTSLLRDAESFYNAYILRSNFVVHLLYWFVVFSYIEISYFFSILIVGFYKLIKKSIKLYNINFKHVVELLIQTSLYISVLASVFALLTVKQSWFLYKVNPLSFETSLGLSQIKDLLYGDYSYFLLFSTVVLLVALLGAAVMTRNKR